MAGSNPKSTNRQGSTGKAQELDKMARKTQSNGWEKLGLTEQGINRQSDTDTMRNTCADNQQNNRKHKFGLGEPIIFGITQSKHVLRYTDQQTRPANNMVQLVNIIVVFSYFQNADCPDVGSQTGAV